MENMLNEKIKIITSERGKDFALIGTNKYFFYNNNKTGKSKGYAYTEHVTPVYLQTVAVQKYCQ